MARNPHLFVVVGSPGSGKDKLVKAVNDLGTQHAMIIPKHTNRSRNSDDGDEMIFPDDECWGLNKCDVVYTNYENDYGIKSSRIWKGLSKGISQVVVISNTGAINKLKSIFRNLLKLVYVYSEISPEEYKQESLDFQNQSYIESRADNYDMAHKVYLNNFETFDHVLIYTGVDEDLYDQIFRLFRAYEHDHI